MERESIGKGFREKNKRILLYKSINPETNKNEYCLVTKVLKENRKIEIQEIFLKEETIYRFIDLFMVLNETARMNCYYEDILFKAELYKKKGENKWNGKH